MGFTIRAAEPGEEGRVVPLYQWLFEPPGGVPPAWDERRATVALRQAIESHDSVVLVAEDDSGEFVGFATGYQDIHSVRFGYRAWVEDLAVHPGRRSEGVGKALLDAAKAWGRERGAIFLSLESALSREDAHRFYEREGSPPLAYAFLWQL